VNVRYLPDFRADEDSLAAVLVPVGDGRVQVPLGRLADVAVKTGPGMIRNEDGLLTGYVYVDSRARPAKLRARGRRAPARPPEAAPGHALAWSGQYEAMERVRERLKVVIPVTLVLILLLLYLNTRSVVKTFIVLLAVPFSAIGPSGSCTCSATT